MNLHCGWGIVSMGVLIHTYTYLFIDPSLPMANKDTQCLGDKDASTVIQLEPDSFSIPREERYLRSKTDGIVCVTNRAANAEDYEVRDLAFVEDDPDAIWITVQHGDTASLYRYKQEEAGVPTSLTENGATNYYPDPMANLAPSNPEPDTYVSVVNVQYHHTSDSLIIGANRASLVDDEDDYHIWFWEVGPEHKDSQVDLPFAKLERPLDVLYAFHCAGNFMVMSIWEEDTDTYRIYKLERFDADNRLVAWTGIPDLVHVADNPVSVVVFDDKTENTYWIERGPEESTDIWWKNAGSSTPESLFKGELVVDVNHAAYTYDAITNSVIWVQTNRENQDQLMYSFELDPGATLAIQPVAICALRRGVSYRNVGSLALHRVDITATSVLPIYLGGVAAFFTLLAGGFGAWSLNRSLGS